MYLDWLKANTDKVELRANWKDLSIDDFVAKPMLIFPETKMSLQGQKVGNKQITTSFIEKQISFDKLGQYLWGE